MALLTGCGFSDAEYVSYEAPEAETSTASGNSSPTGGSTEPATSTTTGGTTTTTGGTTTTTDPEDPGTDPDPTVDECPALAITAYADNVKTAVDNTCANNGCHANAVPGLVMSGGNDSGNRSALMAWGSAAAIGAYIGPAGSHGGGDLSGVLPTSNLEAWMNAEATCAN